MATSLRSTPDDTFALAAEWILSAEGGYVHDPADPGGETKYGISARAHPDVDIAALTRTEALGIYRSHYWEAFDCGALHPAIGIALFDGLVQHRPGTAVRLLQHQIGARGDGLIGPQTIAAANAADPAELLPRLLAARVELYAHLVAANTSLARFETGWYRRVMRLASYLYLHGVVS